MPTGYGSLVTLLDDVLFLVLREIKKRVLLDFDFEIAIPVLDIGPCCLLPTLGNKNL